MRWPRLLKRISFFSTPACCLLIASCSSMTLDMPVNQLETPEIGGRPRRASAAIAVQGAHQVTLAKDFLEKTPDLEDPTIKRNNAIGRLDLAFTIWEPFELSLKASPDSVPFLQVKYQIFGKSAQEAKKNDLSLAILFGSGFWYEEDKRDPFDRAEKSEISLQSFKYQFMLLAGFRLTDEILLYGGPFHNRTTLNGKRTIKNRVSDQLIEEEDFSGMVFSVGGNVGLHVDFDENKFLKLEESFSLVRGGETTFRGFYTAVQFGVRF